MLALRMSAFIILVHIIILAAVCQTGVEQASDEYDPSVFMPNGVVYKFQGNLSVSGIRGYLIATIGIFSREHSNGYCAWGFSVWVERYHYEGIELPSSVKIMLERGVAGIPLPPLIAVKRWTREAYLMIDFNEIRELLSGAPSLDVLDLLSRLFTIVGEINEEVYFTNPLYIPINVGLNSELAFGVYRISGEKYETHARINAEGIKEVAGGSYDAWIISLNRSAISDILAELGAPGGTLPKDVSASTNIYYDKASGWLLSYETHAHRSNTTYAGDYIDITLELIEPGTVNIGGRGLLERKLGLPRAASLCVGLCIIGLSALIRLTRSGGR